MCLCLWWVVVNGRDVDVLVVNGGVVVVLGSGFGGVGC